jgi:hypothetical protein
VKILLTYLSVSILLSSMQNYFFLRYVCGNAAANGRIVHPTDDTCVKMEQWWDDIGRGNPNDSEKKSVPVPLCPPQIPHGLPSERTRFTAVKSRRLSASAMARPPNLRYYKNL